MLRESTPFFKYNFGKIIYFSFFLFVLLLAFLMFFIDKPSGIVILMLTPIALVLLVNFNKYYLYYLTAGLFMNLYFYVPLGILVISIVAFIIFFIFFFNKDTNLFNSLSLPKLTKFASYFFIFSVFLSSVNSVHRSFQSLYFFFLFLTYISTGYMVFRSVKNSLTIEKFFNFYFICMAITCIIIIMQIIITSSIRSVGLMDYSIMDFSAITLTVLILKYFIMGNTNFKIISISLITLTVLITTQSRFAWIGFMFSLIYGIIIVYKYDIVGKKFIRKRIYRGILFAMIILGGAISLGVHNFIFTRFSDVSLNLFEPTEEGEFIHNSLETRALIWITAYNAFQANQLTGVGYQMFQIVSENYNVLPLKIYEEFVETTDPHNTMLAFLTETGVIGFCSFLIFMISSFIYSFKSIKISTDRRERINSIILNVIVFFVITNSFYSGQYTMNLQAFFMYIFFGLSIGNYVFLSSMWQNKIKLEKKL